MYICWTSNQLCDFHLEKNYFTMTTLMSQVYNNRDLCEIPGKGKKNNLGKNTDTAFL